MSYKNHTVSNGGTTTGFDPAPNIPTGTLAGDRLTVVVSTSDNNPSITPTTPSGWTLEASGSMPIDGTGAVSPCAVWIYGKDATADDVTAIGTAPYTWTFSGSEEQCAVMILTDPAEWGEFAKNELTGNRTTINAPAVTTTVDNELVFHCALKDGIAVFSGVPSGDATVENLAFGPNNDGAGCFAIVREEYPSASTNTGTKTFTLASNEANGFTFSLRPSAGITAVTSSGYGNEELDFDDSDVDVDGLNFEASQGTGTVYISDASTLAGSANEVEISGAVNTWSDTQINLDFTGLSQTEINNLHTLGPGARYLIVVNNSSDEYSFAITLHRPNAIEMAAGAATPGSTTQRLSGLTGTFGGGRIEETAAQNPSTTNTDIAEDGNREDVWSMQFKTAARDTITYDFRLVYTTTSNVADTITQTPQATFSAAAQSPAFVQRFRVYIID